MLLTVVISRTSCYLMLKQFFLSAGAGADAVSDADALHSACSCVPDANS